MITQLSRNIILIVGILCFAACGNKDSSSPSLVTSESCKGIYYSRDSSGNLQKFNQYYQADQSSCLTDNISLSQWEKTSESWTKNKIKCTPQQQFASRSLVTANNFYSYRDGKVYLDLNSSTGIYRRITLGEDKNGNPSFTRTQGCFYQRTGSGVDASFGSQILLDTDSSKLASSEYFEPMEIFRYDETSTTMNMTRFDLSSDWDFKFCPYLNTPWEFCTLLRDGNMMYWPTNLTSAQQNDLLNEALLIRKQFNYSVIANSDFENMWNTVDKSRAELGRDDWKYVVIPLPDTPWYIDQAWRDYVMSARPTMPNVNSNTMPQICYSGSQNVTLPNGSIGKIYGEICYANGVYVFTAQ